MSNESTAIVEVRDLRKIYTQDGKELEVLKGVSLRIDRGEMLSIVGKSGAGKSTLLHLIGTLDRPTSGQLWLDGRDTRDLSGAELALLRNELIGFVFQFHHLLPEFNAIENVCMPAFILGTKESDARKKAEELLEYLGLSDRLHHKPSELSGGEQQRVAVARALINQPKVILADEPSGNLDTQTSGDLHRLFFKLRDDFKQTFVIVTHNMELAKMSDRIVEMADGRIL